VHKPFWNQLLSEFIVPLMVVTTIFALAAFWPIERVGSQSASTAPFETPSAVPSGTETIDGNRSQSPVTHPAIGGDAKIIAEAAQG
jgi:hypothetical protein